jgi:transcriptional regulator with XRE-family HTH domain
MYPNLKLQIWKTGLRQNRLAQLLDLDETMLSKIVNGFREPTDSLKTKIATLLESDVAWLFHAENGSGVKRLDEAGNANGAAGKESQ